MRHALSHRKPLLGRWKFFPAGGTDLPTHLSSRLICRHARMFGKQRLRLRQTPLMVCQQRLDARCIIARLPVSRQGKADRIFSGQAQAVKIIAQRIL